MITVRPNKKEIFMVQTEIENYDGTKIIIEHDDSDLAREHIARRVARVCH